MKEQFTTNVINLKSYNISEADKIVLMYSKDKGLIKGIAKGVKKTTAKLGGRIELLVANKMLLNKGININTICQAETLNSFLNIRNNISKLFYAMYCSEIVTNFGIENDPNSEDIYNLFYTFLEQISIAKTKSQVMLYVIRFQLKIMNITGYSIELSNCVKCQTKIDDEFYFSIEQGGTICRDCINYIEKKVKIHKKIIEFLKTLLREDFLLHTKYDDLANEEVCTPCINLLKNYIEYYSPKKFKTTQVLEMC